MATAKATAARADDADLIRQRAFDVAAGRAIDSRTAPRVKPAPPRVGLWLAVVVLALAAGAAAAVYLIKAL